MGTSQLPLHQWFLPGVILPTREHAATSENSFDCHKLEGRATGIYWIEARDAAKHPKMHRMAPMSKNYPKCQQHHNWEILAYVCFGLTECYCYSKSYWFLKSDHQIDSSFYPKNWAAMCFTKNKKNFLVCIGSGNPELIIKKLGVNYGHL